ncbi:MAG: TonB-dependent receptor [Gammaproteobacteria bacterium]|nr:TonB-dependent receptor [Gammaproteobacteria bacterium]
MRAGKPRRTLSFGEWYPLTNGPTWRRGIMKLKMTRALAALLTLSLVAWAVPQSVVAQAPQEAAIEEVVVTAQKRSQSIEDVPLSISATTGEALRDSLTIDAKDLFMTTPGLSGFGADDDLSTMSIRGVSRNDFGIGGDPAIGVFKNGVYSGTSGEALTSFYDIDRVEVLRGPQGLLFGRAAIGGALHVVTRKPSLDGGVSGSFGAGGGERGQLRMDGAVNIPASDTLAFRLAGFHREEDGWVNNLVPGPDSGASNYEGFRASALYEEGPLSVFVMGEYDDREGPSAILVPIGASLQEPVLSDSIYDIESDLDRSDNRETAEIFNFMVEINYEMDSGTLTSLTGVRTHDRFYAMNEDASAVPFINSGGDQDGEYYSQELRFVSSDEGSVRWFMGVSGFVSRVESDGYTKGAEEIFCLFNLGADCTSFLAQFGVPWLPSADGSFEELSLAENESAGASVYADITFNLSDAARFSLGLRYSYEERDFTVEYPEWPSSLIDDYFGILYWVAAGRTTEPVKSSESWSNLSPRALIEFDLGANAMIYASATNGFKPGGFNGYAMENAVGFDPSTFVPLYNATSSVASYDEEKVWSYEVGVKGTFLDGGGRYALSGYYYDYEDLQTLIFGAGGTTVDNLGSAEGLGLEFEVSAALNEYLSANLGVSLAKSDIGDMENDLEACSEPHNNYSDCNGNRLAFHPEFSASASLMANVPMGSVEWFGVAEIAHQDHVFSAASNNPQYEVDAWTMVNFRVGAYIGDGWQVSAFVENAFDEELLFYGYDLYFVQVGADPSVPRTFGFDVRYEF